MSFATPTFTRGEINRAGTALITQASDSVDFLNSLALINHWRACHAYPINTFQATLRGRVKRISTDSLVATRMKRLPSIVSKLERNHGMQLSRMQDVGGLRAVLASLPQVRQLQEMYLGGGLTHDLIGTDDYIENPKPSGYRSLHLIYRYSSDQVPAYNGLSLELQFRTRLQHAWATAVETIGSFLNQALKSSEGSDDWLEYFQVVSSAFAVMEKCPVAAQHAGLTSIEIFDQCVHLTNKLDVRRKLNAFAVAANAITSRNVGGNFHLIVLDAVERTVSITSFGRKRLEEANAAYADAEKKAAEHVDMQTVLVTTSSVDSLRRAFPNYFLDTKQFLLALQKIDRLSAKKVIG
jgi:putative GTP pyrophosphokinase